MTCRAISCLLAMTLAAGPVFTQNPPPPARRGGETRIDPPAQQPKESPPVRVTTRLVQVSVVVKDRKGNPVEGLTKDDFFLEEDGKPQAVELFGVERYRVVQGAPPAPPGYFSNYLDSRGSRPSSITVILLDGLNTSFSDQAYSRQEIIKFLKQLEPGDRIALYTLGSKLTVLHDFTDDTARLLRALDRHRGRTATELATSDFEAADTGDTELDDFLDDANQRISDFYTVNRVRTTIRALELISNHLGGFPGRKNLVWVSGAFPFHIGMDSMEVDSTRDRRLFSEEITRAVRALNAANIAIYPVDARGLEAPFPGRTGPVTGGTRQPAKLGPGLARYDRLDTMNELADRTGGRAFYNTNDIKNAIRRAIEDTQLTYVLGYYPKHNQWTGKFHDIKVKLKRGGANIRYRRGYFALPEPEFDEKQGERLMMAAVWNPLDATGLRFSVRATPLNAAGENRIKLDIRFLPEDLRLTLNGGRYQGALEYLFAQRTEDGTVYVTPPHRQNLQVPRNDLQRVATAGMTLTRHFELKPKAELVMVVARDPESGNLGSVRIPLDKLPPEN